MLRRQRPLAWAPYVKKLYRRPNAVPYIDYGALMRHKDVVGLLHDHSSALEDFIPRSIVSDIVDEQVRTGSRTRLLAVLTSMAVWRASVRARRPAGARRAFTSRLGRDARLVVT